MTVVTAPPALEKTEQTQIHARVIIALWIIGGLLLTLFLGNPPVTRTQEARVLETARQMLGQPAHAWLVPQLNGAPRLQKPPLMYWLSATSFSAGRIDEFWGRLPIAIIGWALLATVYRDGKWLFGQRAGLIAATTMLGSYFFYRHSRLAETDIPVALFVTLAILASWRAADEERFARQAAWFHLAAASAGLAIMSKGAPGAFAALFLVALIVVERRWSLGLAFLKSGAMLTVAVIAIPWFAYVGLHEGWHTFAAELNNNVEGGDHGGSALRYIPELFIATAPWCGLLPIAIFAAIKQRRDVRMRRMLIWLLCIAVPLCLEGNKQKHYLIPLMPPLMLLIGWLIDRAIDRTDGIFGLTRAIFLIMMGLTALVGLGVLIASRAVNGTIAAIDVIMALALLMFAGVAAYLWRRQPAAGIAAMLASVAVMMPLMVGLWAPTMVKSTVRQTASELAGTFGTGPYAFVGSEISLPLCWELKSAIPLYETEADALSTAKADPALAVISLAKDKRPPVQLSSAFVRKMSLRSEDRILEVYQLAR